MCAFGLFALHWVILVLSTAFSVNRVAAGPSFNALASDSSGRARDVQAESSTAPDELSYISHPIQDTTSHFKISVIDTAGQDHSQNFHVLHSPSDISEHALEKREYSRPLDQCPDDEVFTESYCNESASPQSYVIICAAGLDHSWYFRRCAPAEVCIQGIPKPNPPLPDGRLVPPTRKAYCVSVDNFRKIAQDQLGHKTVPGMIGMKYKAPKGKTMAVEAVLTGQNMSESIFASSLQMSAQTSDTSNNVQVWRSQVGGTVACTDCARILIAPVPEKTQRIVMSIVLKAGAAGGLLFLSSVAI